MLRWAWVVLVLAAVVTGSGVAHLFPNNVAQAQGGPPPIPATYSGGATSAGVPVPDGLIITARIEDYTSVPVVVEAGRYDFLQVGPPDATYSGKTITFHLDGVQADQTDSFRAGSAKLSFNLTFPRIPEPTPTPSPIPTATPIPTPTPMVALPAVYSGLIIIAGGTVPEGAVLVAQVGPYQSLPAVIEGEGYRNLVVDPDDLSLVGQPVEFFLNGGKSRTSDLYRSGSFNRDFDLVFVEVPTPTATPTPPTATRAPPTATLAPLMATPTAVPPTATSSPTPVPPTATPSPTPVPLEPEPTATPTPVAPTPTQPPVSPTATPTEESTTPTSATASATLEAATPSPEPSGGGGCGSTYGQASPMAGAGNLMFLLAPLALIVGWRSRRQ